MLDTLQITELSNGIKVVSLAKPEAESVQIAIHVRVGSRNETEMTNGASHFIEHMLFKGTARRTAKIISQTIEGKGGSINAFTDKDNTCYHATVPYTAAATAFDVLGDLFYHSLFDEREIQRESHVIAEEIHMYDDQPDSVAMDMLYQQLWSGHPLGRPILGSRDNVLGFTRDALLTYRAEQYAPCRTVFSFAGRVTHSQCVKAVEKLAGHLKNPTHLREPEPFSRVIPLDPLSITRRDIQQTQLAFGWRTPGLTDDKSRFALAVLSCALGGTMMSRLFQTIRERKGLCYSIHSGTGLHIDCGTLVVAAGCDATKAYSCARAIVREVRRIMDKPMSEAELRRTRDYLCGRFRLRMDSTPIGWAAGRTLFNLSIDPQKEINGVQTVTAAEVQALAEEILQPNRLALTVVAPNAHKRTAEAWSKVLAY